MSNIRQTNKALRSERHAIDEVRWYPGRVRVARNCKRAARRAARRAANLEVMGDES